MLVGILHLSSPMDPEEFTVVFLSRFDNTFLGEARRPVVLAAGRSPTQLEGEEAKGNLESANKMSLGTTSCWNR